ncbi:MAG: hypothetical protein PHE55_03200 [Methylococcaceae bacterium]|nr:hypothetical protein [Methylococcaceae bacterium]
MIPLDYYFYGELDQEWKAIAASSLILFRVFDLGFDLSPGFLVGLGGNGFAVHALERDDESDDDDDTTTDIQPKIIFFVFHSHDLIDLGWMQKTPFRATITAWEGIEVPPSDPKPLYAANMNRLFQNRDFQTEWNYAPETSIQQD